MPSDNLINLAKEQHEIAAEQSSARHNGSPVKRFKRFGGFVLATVVLVLCFSVPLYHLVRFAATSVLYSYILLVPFVSLYLVWVKRGSLPQDSEPVRRIAVLPLVAGSVALVVSWVAVRSAVNLAKDDYLALATLSFLLFFVGVCYLFLGKETVRAIAFSIGFLVFMVPFPEFLRHWIEAFLQHSSAAAAYVLFRLSGTPVFQHGLEFQLPGFSMEVAPECSGIRSSLVLFMTSLLAGYLFLRTPWKRAVLTLVVIPLAILRNGLRIFTIAQLCVHIGPEMIRSPIHRHGGPFFFLLSLVPLVVLLIVLRKSDRVGGKLKPPPLGA